MGGISSTIRLTDAMTPVLVNITNALHATLSAFEAVQTAASANMNTAAFDAARASIQQADIALSGYQEKLNQLNNQRPPNPPSPQPPQPPPSSWQNLNMSQIFTNSGAERFTEEINATNSAIRQVLQSQQQISTQAASIHIIPSSALNDFNNVQERVHQIQSAMLEIQNIPLHMRTDTMNNQLEVIRGQMQQIGELQNQLGGSLRVMDTQAANASLQQLNDMLENVTRHIRDIHSQQITPQWQNINAPQLFMNSGADRFTEEINAANNSMREVLQTQQQISSQAASMNIIPPSALNDFNNVQEKFHSLQSAMMEIQNIPLYMRTDAMNNQIEGIRQQMQDVGALQNQISNSIIHMDTASANASLQQLNDMMDNVMRNVRSINAQQITPQWQNLNTSQVFTNSGADRFIEEINAINNSTREILQTQQQISSQATSMHIIPPSAFNDFNNVEEKFHLLQSSIREIENIPMYLRTDSINNQIESIRQQMQGIGTLQNQISNSIVNMDTANANASLQQLNDAMDNIMRGIRSINAQQITPQWQSVNSIPIFQNTGSERFQAEINAANTAMQKMLQVQNQVRASSANIRILPPAAQQDITNMGNRVQQLAQKIQQINRIPVSMRTEALNNQLENMRGQLAQATQSMQALNSAMQQADLSAANAAAQQLNSILDTTERNIRDNINAQNNFNQSVTQGTVAANGLESMIKRYGAAILSFTGVKKVLNLSDTLTQTTARINLMTEGLEDVAIVQNKIFNAAQRARGSYQQMTDMVGSFGIRAKAAFSNTGETIKFVENLNKIYAIAGTKQAEAEGATLQLTQALGSGVLRGQEFNSVFKAAPNLIQYVVDYMGKDISEVRKLAEEGKLSASIVKNALLSATESIDEKFNQMPVTFEQTMTSIANQALIAFQPVLTQISEITSSDRFNSMVNGVINGITTLASVATEAFNVLTTGAAFVYDNWSVIEPLVAGVAVAYGVYTAAVVAHNTALAIHNALEKLAAFQETVHVAATARQSGATFAATVAQYGFNAALMACPLTWIIVIIIAVIAIFYALIAVINKVTNDSISATGLIVGALNVALAAVKNVIFVAIELVFTLVETIVNLFATFANFFTNLFNDPVASVIHLFADMADSVLGIIEGLAKAIDMVFGSSLATHVAGWRDSLASVADEWAGKLGNGTYEAAVGTLDMDAVMAEMGIDLQRTTYTDAWNTGYDWGAALFAEDSGALLGVGREAATDYLNNDLLAQGNYNTAAIADSTHDITDSLDISNEDIKYLKDIAERDAINRYTTAEIKLDVGSINNTVNDAQDLDGIADYLIYQLLEDAQASAAGYHR